LPPILIRDTLCACLELPVLVDDEMVRPAFPCVILNWWGKAL
jgi:hypothetical protein